MDIIGVILWNFYTHILHCVPTYFLSIQTSLFHKTPSSIQDFSLFQALIRCYVLYISSFFPFSCISAFKPRFFENFGKFRVFEVFVKNFGLSFLLWSHMLMHCNFQHFIHTFMHSRIVQLIIKSECCSLDWVFVHNANLFCT